MSDPKRDVTYKKSRFKRRAETASTLVSQLFRRVKLGGDIKMGEVYDMACKLVGLGHASEKIAQEAAKLGMASEVLADLAQEGAKLQMYSTGLRKVSEAYFGFPVKGLPVYEPSKEGAEKVEKVTKSIQGILDDLEG